MRTLVALIIFTLVVASPVPEKVEKNNLVDYYAYIDEDYVYEDNVTQYLDHRPPLFSSEVSGGGKSGGSVLLVLISVVAKSIFMKMVNY